MCPSSIDIFYSTLQRYQASLVLSDAATVFRPVRSKADELNLPGE
jgi:hypothetical protein